MSLIESHNTCVCVATYRRNDLLQELLESIRRTCSELPLLIVVDNDPARSAIDIVKSTFPEATYISEPRPGIAAARNAALDALPIGTRAVIFVDDDERVHDGWLEHLIRYANVSGADVVTGPVLSILPEKTPRWIEKGGFIQRERYANGPYPYLPATNNTLVRAEIFRQNDVRFSESFSLTGGSDTELFNRVRNRGATIHWCESAIVEETVPLERLTAKWIWKRGVRSGNVLARIQLQQSGRIKVIFGGVARFCYGTVRVFLNALRLQPLRYADAIYVMRGVGFVNAVFGRLHVEYARKPNAELS